MVEEGFPPLDAGGHGGAVDFSQDVPRQIVMKIPQAQLFTILTGVDVAVRASRMPVPPEQAPQLVIRPDGQSLIKHLAHGPHLEAVAYIGKTHVTRWRRQ